MACTDTLLITGMIFQCFEWYAYKTNVQTKAQHYITFMISLEAQAPVYHSYILMSCSYHTYILRLAYIMCINYPDVAMVVTYKMYNGCFKI